MKSFWFPMKLALAAILLLASGWRGPWGAPAVQAAASACAPSSLHGGLISASETWCAGGDNIHYLTSDLTVQAGATLTIAAGVTVTSAIDTWGKYLNIQGHLDIQGSAAQPVLLTHANPAGTWGGLIFDGSTGGGSGSLSYATIERAGANLGGYGGAQHAVLVKDLGAGKQVSLSHVTLRNNAAKGLFLVNSTASVTNSTFSQQKYPIVIEGASAVISYTGNTFSGNGYPYYDNNGNYTVAEDAIFISPGALMGQDFSLPAQTGLDAYIFLSGTTIPAGRTVTVAPGQTLRTGGAFLLTVKGALQAVGTQALPIRITGVPHKDTLTDVLGWGGLLFDGREGGGTGLLDYVTLEKGGDNGVENGPYSLLVRDTPAPGQVVVNHSTIQDSYGFGVRVLAGNLALSNSLLQRNTWPLQIEGAAAQVALLQNTFANNTNSRVTITPAAMTAHNINLTLQTGLGAYYLTDTFTVPSGITLTVQPGVVVRAAEGKFLVIQGQLQAVGTLAQPVTFSDPALNNAVWGGLIFDGAAGASGRLEHALIEHGCTYWNGKGCANLLIDSLQANKTVVVEHSTFTNSISSGIAVINSPTAQIDHNLVTGCRFGLYLATALTLRNVAVLNSVMDAVFLETGANVDARHLTLTYAGSSGMRARSGAVGQLRNSLLSHNALAAWAEGTGTLSLDANLSEANTSFKSGSVTDLHTYAGAALLAADGYHLLPGSAAVGKGLAALAPRDIDGDPRPWPACRLPDLGADEISAGGFCVYLPALRR